ncbi:MAG: ATP-dependent Clp protease ATP-binding subunit, partial [Desulfuromonadales bacterium]|nr:ATP-dependent Clp protease ATP-binding subunit [Desulfuromonadales bacterium]NIS43318.1 ATP-dependent Clp protease ATP-binding subunit [Desulfuromonadales bacterium]
FSKQNFEEVAQIRQSIIEIDKKLAELRESWKKDLADLDMYVTEDDIANVVADWTGIPVNKIKETEAEKLLKMEENLHKRVISQEQAILAVSN